MDDDSRVEFDLNSALKCYHNDPKTLPCSDADAELLDAEESTENLTNAQINGILNPIIDAVALNPDAIAKVNVLDNLQCLLK
jgi:condensin complex subunit 1